MEKKYEELTTFETMQKSEQLLSNHDKQHEVEKEFYQEPPKSDTEAKEWCYEREMAYKRDELVKQLFTAKNDAMEKKAADTFDCMQAEQ